MHGPVAIRTIDDTCIISKIFQSGTQQLHHTTVGLWRHSAAVLGAVLKTEPFDIAYTVNMNSQHTFTKYLYLSTTHSTNVF